MIIVIYAFFLAAFGCGAVHQNTSGYFGSKAVGNVPGSYDNGRNCTWVLIAGDGYYQVLEITILYMNIEQGESCSLQVRKKAINCVLTCLGLHRVLFPLVCFLYSENPL